MLLLRMKLRQQLLLLLLILLPLSHHHGMHLLEMLVECCLRLRHSVGGVQQRRKSLWREAHGRVDRLGRHRSFKVGRQAARGTDTAYIELPAISLLYNHGRVALDAALLAVCSWSRLMGECALEYATHSWLSAGGGRVGGGVEGMGGGGGCGWRGGGRMQRRGGGGKGGRVG